MLVEEVKVVPSDVEYCIVSSGFLCGSVLMVTVITAVASWLQWPDIPAVDRVLGVGDDPASGIGISRLWLVVGVKVQRTVLVYLSSS